MSEGRATRALGRLSLTTTPLLPLWWLAQRRHARWSVDLDERWGRAVPAVLPGSVWVHAASVGEVNAVSPLLEHLRGPVLLTADTDTGAARARTIASGLAHVVAAVRPVDHPWVLAPLWAEARPRCLIFVEGAWWPTLAALASRGGVPVVRVNGKVGRRTRRLGAMYPVFTDAVRAVVARDDESAGWFRARGVEVLGVVDLKRARPVPVDLLRWNRDYVVGASTRPGDERALLRSLKELPEGLGLVLAPRHGARFDEVWSLVLGEVGEAGWRRSHGPIPARARVVLLDTLGELAGALGPARAAFIGGTFDAQIGGHSPSEALNAGVPVVAGTCVHSDPSAFAGVVRVASAAELGAGLMRALSRGRAAACASDGGAAVAAMLMPWTTSSARPEVSPRPWLAPVGWGVRAVTSARNRLYDGGALAVHGVGVPVISVGSANARGAGKTPAAAWVAGRLRARGHRVGVALRGYRRSAGGGDVRVGDTPDAASLGDEGAELAALGFLVAAGPDRVACARALVARGVSVVVLDDGLQHRRLRRDLDLVVVDLDHPGARGPLPAGERRERAIPQRVEGVIFVGEGVPAPTLVPHVQLRRVQGPWHRGRRRCEAPLGPVLAVCGVGRPGPFVHGLKAEIEVARVQIAPDHGRLELGGELPRVCTAKDAARMGYPDDLWWRAVSLKLVGDDMQEWFSRFDHLATQADSS